MIFYIEISSYNFLLKNNAEKTLAVKTDHFLLINSCSRKRKAENRGIWRHWLRLLQNQGKQRRKPKHWPEDKKHQKWEGKKQIAKQRHQGASIRGQGPGLWAQHAQTEGDPAQGRA